MPNAPTGMIFQLNSQGVPVVAQNFPDYSFTSEVAYPGDWQLIVTGVPPGVTPAAVAALIVGAPVALPLPWKSLHWQIAYASLGGACTATAW